MSVILCTHSYAALGDLPQNQVQAQTQTQTCNTSHPAIQKMYDVSSQTLWLSNYFLEFTQAKEKKEDSNVRLGAAAAFVSMGTASLTAQAMMGRVGNPGLLGERTVIENTAADQRYYRDRLNNIRAQNYPPPPDMQPRNAIGRTKKPITLTERKIQEIVQMMDKYPENVLFYKHNKAETMGIEMGSVEKGPTKTKYAAMGRSLPLLRGVLHASMLGLALEGLQYSVRIDDLGCDQVMHNYVEYRNTGSTCDVQNKLGPKTFTLLTLPQEEQNKVLAQVPHLCDIYAKVGDEVEKNLKQAFQIKVNDAACTNNGKNFTAKVELKKGSEASVQLSGNKMTITDNDGSYDVEYNTSSDGNWTLKSIIGQQKVTQAGVYGAAYRYNFPVQTHNLNNQRFQQALNEVARVSMAMKELGAFDGKANCSGGSGSNSGGLKMPEAAH